MHFMILKSHLMGRNKRDDLREAYRERSHTVDSDVSLGRSFDSSGAMTPDASPCVSPVRKDFPHTDFSADRTVTGGRPRSSTVGAIPESDSKKIQELAKPPSKQVESIQSSNATAHSHKADSLSSKRNMFHRANTSVRSRSPSPPHSSMEMTSPTSPPPRTPRRQGSWRRNIFNRVVTPGRRTLSSDSTYEEETDSEKYAPHNKRHLSAQSIRALWRKAILETLLLIRMEKENKSLQARQDAMETKRLKLDYEEITPCLKEVTKVWDEMLMTTSRAMHSFKEQKILDALKAGVPRSRRGDIWQLMVEQHRLHNPDLRRLTEDCHAPYEDLLKQLTTHQHAILIDLGRTFPSHPYFSTQLGAGQLSLFNLLKAYSLLDKEVGYCQGLSFVAGVLLMHMQEECAFETLEYMMFQLGFRKQYRPDMVCLQIQMYQLSRLLHDRYRDLYEHFEEHEIAPTLYAAPWFLTLFASQFPLGFVARVFDLIFWQGMEIIFKVALVLLGNHKELIMQCDSFESVVEFLKTTLPEMGIIQMERIINQVFELDISKQLQDYEVEYHVLQEEMMLAPSRGDADLIAKLELSNQNLRQQNRDLIDQLQSAHSQSHSLDVQLNQEQATQNKLKSHIRALELERAALLNAVTKLRSLIPEDVLNAADINIPSFTSDVPAMSSPVHMPSVTNLLKLEASSSHKQQSLSAEANRLSGSNPNSRSNSPKIPRAFKGVKRNS